MRIYLYFLCFIPLILSCSPNPKPQSNESVVSQEQNQKKEQGDITIQLASDYSVWKRTNNASIDVEITNLSNAIYTSSCLPFIIIYNKQNNQAQYWAMLDLSNGLNLGPQQYSVVSLAAKNSKKLSPLVSELMWQHTESDEWPNTSFFDIVKTGKYVLRLEMNIYDEKTKTGQIVSNDVEIEVAN